MVVKWDSNNSIFTFLKEMKNCFVPSLALASHFKVFFMLFVLISKFVLSGNLLWLCVFMHIAEENVDFFCGKLQWIWNTEDRTNIFTGKLSQHDVEIIEGVCGAQVIQHIFFSQSTLYHQRDTLKSNLSKFSDILVACTFMASN